MNSFITKQLPILLIGSLLTSCAIFAPDEREELAEWVPSEFSLYSDSFDQTNRWWETFQSVELNHLVQESVTNSPSIQEAWARLSQAEAIANMAGADRLPTAGYTGQAGVSKSSATSSTSESYLAGINISYEVDLWGRIKSKTEAAALDYSASREQLNTVAQTLASQTALRWSAVIAHRLQTEVIKKQLEANQTSLELIELRFRSSLSTALDVYQQRQSVSSIEARLPLSKLSAEVQRNELAALLGRVDLKSVQVLDTQLPQIPPLPAIGIPADLLANRPDVRKAGLALQSADWKVSAARADRLPAIRLTASANYSNTEVADLFDDWFVNLAGSLTGPIFDGGRRKSEVARTRAVAMERLANYRATVVNAIKEVENALISEQKQREYIERLDQQIEDATRSYEEALNRYRYGLVEYTTVLVQLTPLQAKERERIEAQYTLLSHRIQLYTALGGSWSNELEPITP